MSWVEHNVWIAHALNFCPVNLILLVVKAEVRMDATMNVVTDYVERFQDFEELLALCITHMDTVSWTQERFKELVTQKLGLETPIFASRVTSGCRLKKSVLARCREPQDLCITSDTFLNYFKVHEGTFKILKTCRKEITRFQTIKQDFMNQFSESWWTTEERVDVVFEFQAWMLEQVFAAQRRVAEACDFTFTSDDAQVIANEAGHIATLTNQLKGVLLEVRMLAFGFQRDINTDLRKCPHCSAIWAKEEGCDGDTTCGNRVGKILDTRFESLSQFSFRFDGERLHITQAAKRKLMGCQSSGGAGCGKTIAWHNMAPVELPPEFVPSASRVKTDDVNILFPEARLCFSYMYGKLIRMCSAIRQTRAAIRRAIPHGDRSPMGGA
ncbi:unnamed protein product [Effrenium voratum]|nr:unnamed protein product [Effrenium voratum]